MINTMAEPLVETRVTYTIDLNGHKTMSNTSKILCQPIRVDRL
jgi:hypothetical protein